MHNWAFEIGDWGLGIQDWGLGKKTEIGWNRLEYNQKICWNRLEYARIGLFKGMSV